MRLAHSVCLSLVAVLATVGTAAATPVQAGDTPRTYDFNDLGVACGMLTQSTGLYQDLVFPSPAYIARCNTTNGTVGLVPSAIAGGLVEVRVQLPGPASAVSIESYMYQFGDTPTLVGYDENGVELGRDADGAPGQWVTLSVAATGDMPIVEIGLLMPQLANYLDNLTVNYGWSSPEPEPQPEPQPEPEPEPQPDAQPSSPTSVDQCRNGGWADFGFRNQGQCVSFVRTGRDSRGDFSDRRGRRR